MNTRSAPDHTTQITPVFAVPFGQAMHPDPEPLNRELRTLLLARESERYANPSPSLPQQQGVFESKLELFSWPEPCIRKLRLFCWAELGRTIQNLNNYTQEEMERLQIFSHTWFHITRRGGFVINHTHPMASWSGVYCVTPGDNPLDRPDSGVLRFLNPHHYSNVFMDPGNQRFRAPYHHGTWNVRFRPGQLILFPSWLPHEVLPFHGDDERITIAFNCWFGMKKEDHER